MNSHPLVYATWTTPSRPHFLARVAELVAPSAGLTPDKLLAQAGRFSIGPIVLDREIDARIIDVEVAYRPERDTLMWTLSARQQPDGDPPDEVVASMAVFGGIDECVALIESAWEGDKAPVAAISAHAHIKADSYQCLVVPVVAPASMIPEGARDMADGFDLDRVVLRLTGGAMGITNIELGLLHSRTNICVDVTARAPLELRRDGDWLPVAEDLLNFIVARFFKRVAQEVQA